MVDIVKLTALVAAVGLIAGCGGGDGSATPVAPAAAPASAPVALAQPERVMTLELGGSLIAVDEGTLLYRKADGSVHMRLASGTETLLQPPADGAKVLPLGWKLSRMNAFAWAQRGSDTTTAAVYRWQPDGVARKLFDRYAPPGHVLLGALPVVDYPYVAWLHGSTVADVSLAVHHLEAGSFRYVRGPASAQLPAGPQSLASQSTGTVKLAFEVGSLSAFSADGYPVTDVYLWDSATDVTTRVTQSEANRQPQVAGRRLAWVNIDPAQNRHRLKTSALDGSDVRILSASTPAFNDVRQFAVAKDGLIAWTEGEVRATVLKASSDGINVKTVATVSGIEMLGNAVVGAGHVIYSINNDVYAWNAADGSTRLLDRTLAATYADGQALYYVKSDNGQVWRLSLK